MKLKSDCLFAVLASGLILSAQSPQISAQQSGDIVGTSAPIADSHFGQFAQEAKSLAPQISNQNSRQLPSPTATPDLGAISGTVADPNGDVLPGASVILDGLVPADHHETIANENGAFQFEGLRGDVPYRVRVSLRGFVPWSSSAIGVAPGQYVILSVVTLKIDGEEESVTVYGSTERIAVEQVHIEEQQRVFGFIPNFYVVYDAENAVPLTTRLKFKLAMRVSIDPISLVAIASMAAIKQAADTPDYVQGAKGYGQRLGAIAADNFSDIMIGGAVLPSLLHQDPRYFYQGTGTTRSRLRHAFFSPFICRGDNGRPQPNYSTLGGDLASSAISIAYYPQSNRGAKLVFGNFAIDTVERMASDLAQEFIFRRFTPTAKTR